MLEVFNKTALTRKQRFAKGLLFGGLATIVATVILIVLGRVYGFYMPLIYVGVGFGIGQVIQYFGKGVQIQFSILAVVLTIICMLVVDVAIFGIDFPALFYAYDTSSLFEIGYRVAACYFAYRYARII